MTDTTIVGLDATESKTATAQSPGECLPMTNVSGTAWDRAVSMFADVRQEQLDAFIANRWRNMRAEYCLLNDDQNLQAATPEQYLAGAAMMTATLPMGLGGVAITKWAPVLRACEADDAKQHFQQMVDRLVDEYAVRRGLYLVIMPGPFAHARDWQEDILLACGFAQGSKLPFPQRYYVDLSVSADEQRGDYAQKWRYHLKNAEKAGLAFHHDVSADGLDRFMTLYTAMTDRKQFPDYSAIAAMPDLIAHSEQAAQPQVFFVSHEGREVAGAIVFTAGETACYLFGATNDEALPLRAGYFMHDRIITWLKQNSAAKWYDLGGNDGFSGLHRFKKGMVGKSGQITDVPAAYAYGHTTFSRLVGSSLFALRDGKAALARRIDGWRQGSTTGDMQ